MEICVETNDIKEEYIDIIKRNYNTLLSRFCNNINYFVIAPTENLEYAKCVKKYSNMMNIQSIITDNERGSTAGKCLSAIVKNNLVQAMIIKSSVLFYSIIDIKCMSDPNFDFNYNGIVKYKSLLLVLHEIGHICETKMKYLMEGTINNQIYYRLNNPDELVKFKNEFTKSLFSEYYAERFAQSIVGRVYNTYEYESFNKLILSEKINECKNKYDRIFDILYKFSLILGQLHAKEEIFIAENLFLVNRKYFDVLKEYENCINSLYNATKEEYDNLFYKFQKSIDCILEFDIENNRVH